VRALCREVFGGDDVIGRWLWWWMDHWSWTSWNVLETIDDDGMMVERMLFKFWFYIST